MGRFNSDTGVDSDRSGQSTSGVEPNPMAGLDGGHVGADGDVCARATQPVILADLDDRISPSRSGDACSDNCRPGFHAANLSLDGEPVGRSGIAEHGDGRGDRREEARESDELNSLNRASDLYRQLDRILVEMRALTQSSKGFDDPVSLMSKILWRRRLRNDFLPADLFGEPAWDILLDLFVEGEQGRAVTTTSACIAADVPMTTALRWIQVLEDRGLIAKSDDPSDGRRTLVQLTDAARIAMFNWVVAVGRSRRG